MKTFKKVQIEQEFAKEIFCNKCGVLCVFECSDKAIINDTYNVTGISIDHYGSFLSNHFYNFTKYSFDLCEKCLFEFVQSFKIEPTITPIVQI